MEEKENILFYAYNYVMKVCIEKYKDTQLLYNNLTLFILSSWEVTSEILEFPEW